MATTTHFDWKEHRIYIFLAGAGAGITVTVGFLSFLWQTVWQAEYVSRTDLAQEGKVVCETAECRPRPEKPEKIQTPESLPMPRPPGRKHPKPNIPSCDQRTDATVCEWEGLIWQREAHLTSSWEEANSYCAGLTLNGSDRWELPSVDMASKLASSEPGVDGCYVLRGIPGMCRHMPGNFWSDSGHCANSKGERRKCEYGYGSPSFFVDDQTNDDDRWVRCARKAEQ